MATFNVLFTAVQNDPAPPSQVITVLTIAPGFTYTVPAQPAWLLITPLSALAPAILQLEILDTSLAPGLYSVSLDVFLDDIPVLFDTVVVYFNVVETSPTPLAWTVSPLTEAADTSNMTSRPNNFSIHNILQNGDDIYCILHDDFGGTGTHSLLIFKSIDDGLTWNELAAAGAKKCRKCFSTCQFGTRIYIFSDDGILSTPTHTVIYVWNMATDAWETTITGGPDIIETTGSFTLRQGVVACPDGSLVMLYTGPPETVSGTPRQRPYYVRYTAGWGVPVMAAGAGVAGNFSVSQIEVDAATGIVYFLIANRTVGYILTLIPLSASNVLGSPITMTSANSFGDGLSNLTYNGSDLLMNEPYLNRSILGNYPAILDQWNGTVQQAFSDAGVAAFTNEPVDLAFPSGVIGSLGGSEFGSSVRIDDRVFVIWVAPTGPSATDKAGDLDLIFKQNTFLPAAAFDDVNVVATVRRSTNSGAAVIPIAYSSPDAAIVVTGPATVTILDGNYEANFTFNVEVDDKAVMGEASVTVTLAGDTTSFFNANQQSGDVMYASKTDGGYWGYPQVLTSFDPPFQAYDIHARVLNNGNLGVLIGVYNVATYDGVGFFAYFATTSASAALSLECPPITTGTVGTPYSSFLVATGGTPPYTFSIIAGSLPPGLSLNASTGEISGTPTVAGVYPFTAQVVDSAGSPATATADCSITIGCLPCPECPPPSAPSCPTCTPPAAPTCPSCPEPPGYC